MEDIMKSVVEIPFADPVNVTVTDVTAQNVMEVDGLDGHRSAGEVAQSLASLLELPEDTPYSLRDDARARMLVDDVALGSQVETGTNLVLLPKAHLA
jgi:hypothetical protein